MELYLKTDSSRHKGEKPSTAQTSTHIEDASINFIRRRVSNNTFQQQKWINRIHSGTHSSPGLDRYQSKTPAEVLFHREKRRIFQTIPSTDALLFRQFRELTFSKQLAYLKWQTAYVSFGQDPYSWQGH